MPSFFKGSKSTRSQQNQSIDHSGQSSPNPSAIAVNNGGSPRYPPPEQSPLQQQVPAGVPQDRQYPQRAASTNRLSAHLNQVAQPGYSQQEPGPPQPSPGLDQHRVSYQAQSPPAYIPEPKKQSLGSRLAGRLTGHKDEAVKESSKNGVDRRKSIKQNDSRLQEKQQQQFQEPHRLQAQQQQWSQRQSSSPHLPTAAEQDESNFDPFLQQNEQTPQVPPKDVQYQHNPSQHPQFVPHPQQHFNNRPPLDRVSTEGSYNTSGGVSQYSPDQHQPNQQTQQYQSYQPPQQHPTNSNEYQAFQPQQAAPSPLLGNAQLQGQGQDKSPQSYYAYQQQNPNQVQANSPQDNSPQSIQYQQNQYAPQSQPAQPHQGQPYPQPALSQRTSSQQPPELQPPQTNRHAPQIVQQGPPIDTQSSQQLRPPSSQQQLAPPSPLQPQPQQAHDLQQVKPPQATDSRSTSSNTPPQQQVHDKMAPSGQGSTRNTLRKVNDAGQQQPGAPSRESSMLSQPPAQAPQGQPYRGEKGQPGQQAQGGEMGRATPPPRPTVADMTDEEVEKIIKEHEVLREKYQKVKRYFFEQQTQVHQLQNTLANQRLSLSRTSWDDSEYSTRFTRLDGLIAQLSFSIRKDWKAIPQFLHPVVNKTAVETGKQEMTAVGRAFISHWLVENIFEKYFHPDLEPGFSTQLQTIVANIRKFSPPCHSQEDEDSLAAKIINWRLATLEGLADVLRSPQAAAHRQTLLENLNESLIASLQMHMNDPAPADLNGGVPMIVELAISIAQHLPLESREVHIEYFPPGHGIVGEFMKVETGIPALTAPIAEPVDEHEDRASVRSVASKVDDNTSMASDEVASKQELGKDDKKRNMFGFGGGSKKPSNAPANLGKRESTLGAGGSQQSLTQNPPGSSNGPKDEPPAPRVRMAVGVAVQIRGKSILIKAPVYST